MASLSKLLKGSEPLSLLRTEDYHLQSVDEERTRILEQALEDAASIRSEAADILRQAKQTLPAAHAEAARIRHEASVGAEEEGRARGLEAGLAEGTRQGVEQIRQEAAAELVALNDTVAALLKTVEKERHTAAAKAQDELVQFAVSVAQIVCKAEVTAHESIATANVAKAVELALKKSDIQVQVNPGDLDRVERYIPSLATALARTGGLTVSADSGITPGGCRVTHDCGVIDAQIETQIEEIRRQLLGRESDPLV